MSYEYVITFDGPCTLTSTISIVDATLSNFSATKAWGHAVGSGSPSIWISEQAIPAVSLPVSNTQAAITFLFQELVNGVLQIVPHAGTVEYDTSGFITLSCNNAYVDGRICGWQAFNFDFTRV